MYKWNTILKKALQWCDVANVFAYMERQNQVLFSSLREYNLAYGVSKKLLDSFNKEIVIMHPGPINRGVEIDSDVADVKTINNFATGRKWCCSENGSALSFSNKQNF